MTVLNTGVSPSSMIHTGVTCVDPSSRTTPSMPSAFVSKSAASCRSSPLPDSIPEVLVRPERSATEEIAVGGQRPGASADVRALVGQAAHHRRRDAAVGPDDELGRGRDLVGDVHLGSL